MVAARVLAGYPDAEGAAEEIRRTWDTLPWESVVFAVWSYLQLTGEEKERIASLARSDNEHVREAVAKIGPLTVFVYRVIRQ